MVIPVSCDPLPRKKLAFTFPPAVRSCVVRIRPASRLPRTINGPTIPPNCALPEIFILPADILAKVVMLPIWVVTERFPTVALPMLPDGATTELVATRLVVAITLPKVMLPAPAIVPETLTLVALTVVRLAVVATTNGTTTAAAARLPSMVRLPLLSNLARSYSRVLSSPNRIERLEGLMASAPAVLAMPL